MYCKGKKVVGRSAVSDSEEEKNKTKQNKKTGTGKRVKNRNSIGSNSGETTDKRRLWEKHEGDLGEGRAVKLCL